MQEINAWLKNTKDFDTGKSLYIKYGTNSFFKTLLQDGPTPYNLKKLGAELRALAPALPAKPAIAVIPPKPPSVAPVAVSNNELERYLGFKEHLKQKYRQLERNMIELDLCANENILHLTAKNILSLHDKIQEIYKILDYYDEHGKLPVAKIEVIYTPAEEIQLLRQSNSKAKKRLKSPTCRDKQGTMSLIEDNNKKIIQLGGKVKS